MHYVTPMITEKFAKSGEFDSTDCSNFEICNTGQTTVLLNNVFPLQPGQNEFFPVLGHCTAYKGRIEFSFKSEDRKKNEIFIKASRYVRNS